MAITFAEAKEIAREVSDYCDDKKVTNLLRDALDELIIQAPKGSTKKWCFDACKGCFTAPYDMEVPLAARIDKYKAQVSDKWTDFDQALEHDEQSCLLSLSEEPNEFYTIYDVPECGAYIVPFSDYCEDDSAYITIQGLDEFGNDIWTNDGDLRIHGEKIQIKNKEPYHSDKKFSKITGITKPKTKGKVTLMWLKEDQSQGLLAEYRPSELYPSYKRFRISGLPCDCPCARVTVLGRIRLMDYYDDSDRLPVSNRSALRNKMQAIVKRESDKPASAEYHESIATNMLAQELEYSRKAKGTPIRVSQATGARSIKNMRFR